MAKQSHEIKKTQTDILRALNFEADIDMVFLNVHTLRLTKYGCKLLVDKLEHWKLDSIELKTKHILALQQHMQYPYYIDKKQLILFSKRDAFLARLAGSESWLNNLQ